MKELKVYVKVIAEIDEVGKKTPKIIVYDDREFIVDKVIDMKKCASMKVGGVGERYRIRINGYETYLYYERDKWFVEEK